MGCSAGPDAIDNGLILALDAADANSYQQNEISEPTDMYGWYTTIKGDSNANVCTITRDTTTASPVGNEPLKMVVTGTDPYLLSYNSSPWNLAPASQGETWVVSVYVKASTNTSIQLFIFGGNSSGGAFSPTDYSASTINVTTEWKRYSHYHTFAQSATQYVQVRLDGPDTQVSGDANGQEIWWDGIQVERVPSGTTTPGRFNSNSKTFEDLSGRGNNGTLTNSPRRDFDNGGSIVFDGDNDHTISSAVLPSGQQKYTISAWWKTSANNRIQVVWEQNTSTLATNTRAALLLLYGNWGLNGQNNDAHNKVPVRINQWTNGVITVDTTLGTNPIKIYENGFLYWQGDSSGGASNLNVGTSGGAGLGRKIPTNSEYFIGTIAQTQIYDRVLTAQEIQQNFNALRGRFGI